MTKAIKKEKKQGYRAGLKIILRIIRDTKPIALWLALAALLSLISVAVSMIAPELLGRLTDTVWYKINEGAPLEMKEFVTTAAILAAVYALSALLSALTTRIMNYSVSRHFTCRIRIDMSAKISKIPVKTVDTTPNGEIISRMTNDVSVMGGSVHDIFGVIINGIIRLAVITVVIFTVNPVMAAIVITFVPISIVLSAVLASKSEKYYDESRAAAGKVYSLCEEDLTGFDTVKAFGLEQRQKSVYDRLSEDYSEKSRKGFLVSGIVQPVVSFINNVAYVAICLVGGYLAVKGRLSAGTLVSFVMYTKLFSGPLESIAGGMSMMQSVIASAKRVYDFIDGEEMCGPFGTEYTSEKEVLGEVVFEKVGFSYSEEKPLIEDLNLKVNPGQKIAIVGPTGGGKTTIVNLLMRFYDPNAGKIYIDGTDTQSISRESVREAFGMVLQDTVLFSGTVYDNIAYGKPEATREEVIEAARKAHIDSFITALPNGYETVINEDSTNISGGQKQLLTIARAFLCNRPILILDEATSNVDTRTELIIQTTMDELMKDRTAFVIAHRLSTIENADLILVVNEGKIVERGTHKSLLEKNGLYAAIHRSQYDTGAV